MSRSNAGRLLPEEKALFESSFPAHELLCGPIERERQRRALQRERLWIRIRLGIAVSLTVSIGGWWLLWHVVH